SLGEQTGLGHARERVDLENDWVTLGANHDINAGIVPPTNRVKGPQPGSLNTFGGRLIERRRAEIFSSTTGAFAAIIVNPGSGAHLDDRQRLAAEDSHRGLTPDNLFFH